MNQRQLIGKRNKIHSDVKAEELLLRHITGQINFLKSERAKLEESINKKWEEAQVLAEQIEIIFIEGELSKSTPSQPAHGTDKA
jgi:hypothetical protein